jgi:hypothetical protein
MPAIGFLICYLSQNPQALPQPLARYVEESMWPSERSLIRGGLSAQGIAVQEEGVIESVTGRYFTVRNAYDGSTSNWTLYNPVLIHFNDTALTGLSKNIGRLRPSDAAKYLVSGKSISVSGIPNKTNDINKATYIAIIQNGTFNLDGKMTGGTKSPPADVEERSDIIENTRRYSPR